MPAKTPRLAMNSYISAMLDHDLEAAVALYEADATLVIYPGMLAKGATAIRKFFEGLLSIKPDFHYEAKVFTETDDLALFVARWTILGSIPPGLPVQRSNCHVAILRKQPDGNWLIAVDNPWGPDPPPKGEDPTIL